VLKRNPLSLDRGWTSGTQVIGFDQGGLKGSIFSPVFEVPASLKFLLAFRDPQEGNTADTSLQEVRLIDAENNKVLKVQKFKRDLNYVEPTVDWDLSASKGRKAFLEVVNNSPQGGFLKIGAFNPAVIRLPEKSPAQTANLQLFALQIAGKYEVSNLVPAIKEVLSKNTEEYFLKIAALRALMQINDKEHAPLIGAALQMKNSPEVYKKDLIALLGDFPSVTAANVLNNNFAGLSKDLQIETARALVNSSEGIDIVLKRVRAGDIFTRVLLEPKVEERIGAVATAKQLKDYKELVVNLNPVDEERQKLIKDRLAAFKYSADNIVEGRAVFVQNCSPCHRIKKEGGMIGPQLDGIGNWGATALTEKIIDPNQNISEAFRNYTIKLKNGKVMTGLYRREEGEVTVFANASGEEFRLSKKDISERKGSKYTLMPDHFGKVIAPEKFNALLSFLLSNK
jgi:putative heme-binding domain-containing protein